MIQNTVLIADSKLSKRKNSFRFEEECLSIIELSIFSQLLVAALSRLFSARAGSSNYGKIIFMAMATNFTILSTNKKRVHMSWCFKLYLIENTNFSIQSSSWNTYFYLIIWTTFSNKLLVLLNPDCLLIFP